MKRILTLGFLLFSCTVMFSQPVITSAFNPVPGDNYKYHPVNTIITPGSAGANVTWDFSGIQVVYNPVGGRYLSPSVTPYANDFSGCNVAYEDYNIAGTYHFYETSSAKWEKKGEASVLLTAVFNNPQDMFTYPFTYNTLVSDSFTCTAAVGALTLEKKGWWEVTGDAYGTLKLPSGDYTNVLRIKKTVNTYDDYIGVSTYETDVTEYCWVLSTSKKPLLRIAVEFHYANGAPIDTVEYIRISDDVSGLDHPGKIVSNLMVYPNPASDMLSIDFNLLESSEVEIQLLNTEGKLLRLIGKSALPSGPQNMQCVTGDLAPGFYLINLKANGFNRMLKFVKL